jgi:O-antigen/teichoic acid export membrane protein
VYGTVMTATGSIVAFCYLNLVAVVMNIILNFFLIPKYGAFGCCVSALCSQLTLGLATMIFVHRNFGTSIHRQSLIVYLLNGLFLWGVLYAFLKTHLNTWLLVSMAALVTLVVMWIAKMISLNNWLGFLKKR